MGILDDLAGIFGGGTACPACGTPGARQSDHRIYCLNPVCSNFSGAGRHAAESSGAAPTQNVPYTQQAKSVRSVSSQVLAIQYRNYQDQIQNFTVDSRSVTRKNNHILAKAVPSGRNVSLMRNRIQNMPEVDLALPEKDRSGAPWPNARERQVLGYHRKHKSTSPLYEKIKAKYPLW